MNSVENPELSYACDQQHFIDELKAENAKLREALKVVESFWSDVENSDPAEYPKVRNIVRAALAKAGGA